MKRYTYLCCCVDSTAAKVNALVEAAAEIAYTTFVRHCDPYECGVLKDYARDRRRGLTLRNDWAVTYHRSVYAGVPCYYVQHSRIEFIWVRRADAARLRAAGESDTYARQTAERARRTHGSKPESVPARRDHSRRLDGANGSWLP